MFGGDILGGGGGEGISVATGDNESSQQSKSLLLGTLFSSYLASSHRAI